MNGCRAGVCHEMSPNLPGVSMTATNRQVNEEGEDEANRMHKSKVRYLQVDTCM